MIGRALDSNNDLLIENGSFVVVDKGAETAQHVRSRLLFYFGEWFLDVQAGVPYFQEVFTKPANLANIESILKQTIIQTPGVETLNEFSMDYEGAGTRQLNVQFSATTIYGVIDKEEVTLNV